MKGLFVHSHVFGLKDNQYYSEGKLTYDMWKSRYLHYLDYLYVAGRKKNINDVTNFNLSSGKDVSHITLANLSSPKDRMTKRKSVYNTLKKYIIEKNIDVVIVRLPSIHGLIAMKIARRLNKKLIIEMVGDPFNSLWYHGNFFGKLLAPVSYLRHKKVLKKSNNIIFVTENYLQNRYKKNYKSYNTVNISNVNLPRNTEFDINHRIRTENLTRKSIIKIATIGSYSSRYKGIDTGIKTISELVSKGYNAHLYILGSGNKETYKKLIIKKKLENHIHYVAPIKGGKEVLNWLDDFDFYIHPSLTEGLPRALIEAMSRGLPVVATNVGGIPELLDNNMQIKIKDYNSMVNIIIELINDVDKYNYQVLRNYNKSKDYNQKSLASKRKKFWNNILKEQ